jgi:hypothetical protein
MDKSGLKGDQTSPTSRVRQLLRGLINLGGRNSSIEAGESSALRTWVVSIRVRIVLIGAIVLAIAISAIGSCVFRRPSASAAATVAYLVKVDVRGFELLTIYHGHDDYYRAIYFGPSNVQALDIVTAPALVLHSMQVASTDSGNHYRIVAAGVAEDQSGMTCDVVVTQRTADTPIEPFLSSEQAEAIQRGASTTLIVAARCA